MKENSSEDNNDHLPSNNRSKCNTTLSANHRRLDKYRSVWYTFYIGGNSDGYIC
jgi:hypothetical protein